MNTTEQLRAELERVTKERDEARDDANENAKELNRLEDWLICNAEFDLKTGLINRAEKLKERIRDLVAAEAECGELREQLDAANRREAKLREALQGIGFVIGEDYGFVVKSTLCGKTVDILFPDLEGNYNPDHPKSEKEAA